MALLPTAKFAANLLDAGGEVFNVRHPSYGAVGDGVADDGPAWNLARAAVNAAGGIVLVPQGAYLLTTAFTFAAATNVLLVLQPGVVLTGSALPAPTGTNAILDLRSGTVRYNGTGPYAIGGTILGALIVDCYRAEPRWTADLIRRLRLVCEVFGSAQLRSRTQRELRKSEERYRAFINGSTDGLVRIDLEQTWPVDLPADEQIENMGKFGILAECNDAYARMYGFSRAANLSTLTIKVFLRRSLLILGSLSSSATSS